MIEKRMKATKLERKGAITLSRRIICSKYTQRVVTSYCTSVTFSPLYSADSRLIFIIKITFQVIDEIRILHYKRIPSDGVTTSLQKNLL